MANLGSGNGTDYPSNIDIQTPPESGATVARAEVPNDLAEAVIAIETELGIDPAGTEIDVKTFLRKEHNIDGTHTTGGIVKTQSENFSAVLPESTVIIPVDDSIPQITEGIELMTIDYTPLFPDSLLRINIQVYGGTRYTSGGGSGDAQYGFISTLFKDSIPDALAIAANILTGFSDGNNTKSLTLNYSFEEISGDTAMRTYKVRGGPKSTKVDLTFNGLDSIRLFGPMVKSFIRITEIKG